MTIWSSAPLARATGARRPCSDNKSHVPRGMARAPLQGNAARLPSCLGVTAHASVTSLGLNLKAGHSAPCRFALAVRHARSRPNADPGADSIDECNSASAGCDKDTGAHDKMSTHRHLHGEYSGSVRLSALADGGRHVTYYPKTQPLAAHDIRLNPR